MFNRVYVYVPSGKTVIERERGNRNANKKVVHRGYKLREKLKIEPNRTLGERSLLSDEMFQYRQSLATDRAYLHLTTLILSFMRCRDSLQSYAASQRMLKSMSRIIFWYSNKSFKSWCRRFDLSSQKREREKFWMLIETQTYLNNVEMWFSAIFRSSLEKVSFDRNISRAHITICAYLCIYASCINSCIEFNFRRRVFVATRGKKVL